MKQIIRTGLMALGLVLSPMVLAQVSMELEEACYGDVELTDLIVQLSETGTTSSDLLSNDELNQVTEYLLKEEQASLSIPEKLDAALTACSEGRLLQLRNQSILNP